MKKNKPPQILPREPLTQKALKAIKAYTWHRCRELHIFDLLVKYTLEAERMRREDLYAWLEAHGYAWKFSNGYGSWTRTEKNEEKKNA